jgi:hypothetical protein
MSQGFEFDEMLKKCIREKQLQEESELEREKLRSLKTQFFIGQFALDMQKIPAPKSPYPNTEIPKIMRTQFSESEQALLLKVENFLSDSLGMTFSKQQLKKFLKRAIKMSHPDHRPSERQAAHQFTEVFRVYQALKKYL